MHRSDVQSDPKIDPRQNDSFPLRHACLTHHWRAVQLFLEDGRADPSVLSDVCLYNHHDITILHMLLRDGRADPRNVNRDIFDRWMSDVTAVNLLLKDGRADPSKNRSRILLRSIERYGISHVQVTMSIPNTDSFFILVVSRSIFICFYFMAELQR